MAAFYEGHEGPAATEDLRVAQQRLEKAQQELVREETLEEGGHELLVVMKDHFSRFMINNNHLELPCGTTLDAFWRARYLFIQYSAGKEGAQHYEPRLDIGWPRPAVLFYRID